MSTAPADAVDAAIRTYAPAVLDRLNHDFEDAALLIGRVLCVRPGATRAVAVGIDVAGVDVEVTDPAGTTVHRLAFAEPVAGPDDLTAALMALVVRARAASGEEGTTTAERQMQMMAGIRTMLTGVVAVADVHPHLRRITLGGGDLHGFEPLGPDAFLYVLAPPRGRSELTIDRDFTWDAYAEMPEAERPAGAYYTVREWRPASAELDILVVLHGDSGSGSAWASRAAPGDPVAVWGPRIAYEPRADVDAMVLVADDTGLPAAAAILESLPAGMPAWLLAEVGSPAEHHPLPTRADTTVRWLYRDGAAAGTTTLLADAVAALDWPAGRPFVWAAAEHTAVADIRGVVRRQRSVPRQHTCLMAYWRREG